MQTDNVTELIKIIRETRNYYKHKSKIYRNAIFDLVKHFNKYEFIRIDYYPELFTISYAINIDDFQSNTKSKLFQVKKKTNIDLLIEFCEDVEKNLNSIKREKSHYQENRLHEEISECENLINHELQNLKSKYRNHQFFIVNANGCVKLFTRPNYYKD